jgi:hypothetical protein
MKDSMYHRVLRVSAVVCALVLLFESGLVSSSTIALSQNTHLYLANAVGMSTSVEPTELNTLTAELTAQKRLLDQREMEIKEREIEIGLKPGASNDKAVYILASILFVLLVLIILNYVLDFLRSREVVATRTTKTV